MKTTSQLMAAGVLAIFTSTGALAYDVAQYISIRGGEMNCPWCDLSGANFTKVNLSGANLSGANLSGTDLTDAVLTNADLSVADLTGAKISGADLSGTRLAGAELNQVDLSKTKLVGAALETAYCDRGTRFPDGSGFVCSGVLIERK